MKSKRHMITFGFRRSISCRAFVYFSSWFKFNLREIFWAYHKL